MKSQNRERTWPVTAHSAHGGREGRCGWQGPRGQAKSNGEYHAKEFDLCSVDRDPLPGKVGGWASHEPSSFQERLGMAVCRVYFEKALPGMLRAGESQGRVGRAWPEPRCHLESHCHARKQMTTV